MKTINKSRIIKIHSAEITTDVTTTTVGPTSFSTLLTISLYINLRFKYYLRFSASGTNSGSTNSNYFVFIVDGARASWPGPSSQLRSYTTFGHSVAMSILLNNTLVIPEGIHTFGVGWSVSAGTGRILAATNADHHAMLIIEETPR